MLVHLVARRGRIVTVDELLARVWNGVAVERGSVHRAIRVLRRALESEPGAKRVIATLPRRGYRFVAEIAEQRGAEASPARYVGRDALCDVLDRRLAAALSGRTECVLLRGPAGIGKSATLARLARSAAAAGAQVFEGRCIEGPGAPPFRPWARILGAAIRSDSAARVARDLGAGARDVVRAMPEVGAAIGVSPPRGELRDRGARARVHAAIAGWVRRRAARTPLVLLLDDLHRADLDSIRLLEALLRELDDAPLLVAAGHRDRSAGPLADALDAVASLRPEAVTELAELSRGELAELAAARTGAALPDAELDQLLAASGGNPLLAEQLLRQDGPPRAFAGLDAVLHRLLDDASTACRELLAQASVSGREVDPAALAASLEWPEPRVRAALAEAVAIRLLEAGAESDTVRFVHGLIPERLDARLATQDRAERHRRAIEGLLATRAHAGDRLAAIADHACEAAPAIGIERAFEHQLEAARDARDRLAYDAATLRFERALAWHSPHPPGAGARAACLVELGALRVLCGDARAARPHFFEACAIAREIGDAGLFARAALGPTEIDEYDTLDREQVALLREALALVGDREPALRVPLLIALGKADVYGDPALELECTAEAQAVASALGDPELATRSALARAAALGWTEHTAECAHLVEAALQIARRERVSPLAEGAALRLDARERLAAGDRAGFERRLRGLERLAAAQRLSCFDWAIAVLRGALALPDGRFDDARALVAQQLELGDRANPGLAQQVAGVQATLVELAVGEPATLAATMRPLVARFPEVSPWRATLALALARSGEERAASAEVERLLRDDLQPRHRDLLPVVLATLAEAVSRIEALAPVAPVLAKELDRLEDRCVVIAEGFATYGAVDRYRGLCAETSGDWPRAIECFERAIALDLAMGAHPCVARGRSDLARALGR